MLFRIRAQIFVVEKYFQRLKKCQIGALQVFGSWSVSRFGTCLAPVSGLATLPTKKTPSSLVKENLGLKLD